MKYNFLCCFFFFICFFFYESHDEDYSLELDTFSYTHPHTLRNKYILSVERILYTVHELFLFLCVFIPQEFPLSFPPWYTKHLHVGPPYIRRNYISFSCFVNVYTTWWSGNEVDFIMKCGFYHTFMYDGKKCMSYPFHTHTDQIF